jgi:hypothetical protein
MPFAGEESIVDSRNRLYSIVRASEHVYLCGAPKHLRYCTGIIIQYTSHAVLPVLYPLLREGHDSRRTEQWRRMRCLGKRWGRESQRQSDACSGRPRRASRVISPHTGERGMLWGNGNPELLRLPRRIGQCILRFGLDTGQETAFEPVINPLRVPCVRPVS